jgi:hypothetical protein
MNQERHNPGHDSSSLPENDRPPVVAQVNLHRAAHLAEPMTAEPSAPPEQPPPPPPEAPAPPTTPIHHEVRQTLHVVRLIGILLILAVVAAGAFFYLATRRPNAPGTVPGQPGATSSSTPSPSVASNKSNSVSCISQTGPDATTASQTFVDIDGTQCTYRSGPTSETLILAGKLTGRNTEGTGMSVNINVNGKDCSGGESLNYARTYTPMFSNCVFVVPANSAVTIKWRFLSPFGGTASVLRSNKNIAPSVSGVAIPRLETSSERP